jgi:hypothetical protein
LTDQFEGRVEEPVLDAPPAGPSFTVDDPPGRLERLDVTADRSDVDPDRGGDRLLMRPTPVVVPRSERQVGEDRPSERRGDVRGVDESETPPFHRLFRILHDQR